MALQVFALAGYVTQHEILSFVKHFQWFMLFSTDELENLRKLVTENEMGMEESFWILPFGVYLKACFFVLAWFTFSNIYVQIAIIHQSKRDYMQLLPLVSSIAVANP